jgi:7-cyano-7-deazaguanine synthase in queuosine biosynthesis
MTVINVRAIDESIDALADHDLSWGANQRVHAWLADLAAGSTHPASPAVRDLLTFAIAAYVADKAALRRAEGDRWTRDIELRLPLVQPEAWPTATSERLLHRLTGDTWSVHARLAANPLVSWPGVTTPAAPTTVEEVALLSGGLDSLSYLAEVVAAGKQVGFVAHYDPNARKKLQRALYDAVVGDAALPLRQFGVQLAGVDPITGDEKEPTTRARAALFIAGAVAAAEMSGAGLVTIPENGFVSINPPLGPNRLGALSTRTTHPLTIAIYQALLNELGIEITLNTPYRYETKGQVVQRARDAGLGPGVLADTISCAHPLQGRWTGAEFGNCGYCYACLIRRASLHVTGGDPTRYRFDPRRNMREVGAKGGVDFRSVVTALRRPLTPSAVVAAGPVPSDYDIAAASRMLERGRAELSTMIEEGLSAEVRGTIGW